MNQLIETVRAALLPGADAETKARAAAILRSVLATLEADAATPPQRSGVTVTAETESGDVTPIAAPSPTAGAATILDTLLERLRVYLPEHGLEAAPRLRVPLIRVPR